MIDQEEISQLVNINAVSIDMFNDEKLPRGLATRRDLPLAADSELPSRIGMAMRKFRIVERPDVGEAYTINFLKSIVKFGSITFLFELVASSAHSEHRVNNFPSQVVVLSKKEYSAVEPVVAVKRLVLFKEALSLSAKDVYPSTHLWQPDTGHIANIAVHESKVSNIIMFATDIQAFPCYLADENNQCDCKNVLGMLRPRGDGVAGGNTVGKYSGRLEMEGSVPAEVCNQKTDKVHICMFCGQTVFNALLCGKICDDSLQKMMYSRFMNMEQNSPNFVNVERTTNNRLGGRCIENRHVHVCIFCAQSMVSGSLCGTICQDSLFINKKEQMGRSIESISSVKKNKGCFNCCYGNRKNRRQNEPFSFGTRNRKLRRPNQGFYNRNPECRKKKCIPRKPCVEYLPSTEEDEPCTKKTVTTTETKTSVCEDIRSKCSTKCTPNEIREPDFCYFKCYVPKTCEQPTSPIKAPEPEKRKPCCHTVTCTVCCDAEEAKPNGSEKIPVSKSEGNNKKQENDKRFCYLCKTLESSDSSFENDKANDSTQADAYLPINYMFDHTVEEKNKRKAKDNNEMQDNIAMSLGQDSISSSVSMSSRNNAPSPSSTNVSYLQMGWKTPKRSIFTRFSIDRKSRRIINLIRRNRGFSSAPSS